MIWIKKEELSKQIREQLHNMGVEIQLISQTYSPKGTQAMIQQIAHKLNASNKALFVLANIENELKKLKPIKRRPRVLFIYARGPGTLMVSGRDTPIDQVISLAGGQNAITSFSGFKPIAPEFLLKAKPQAILLFESGWDRLKGLEGLSKIPAIKYTPAFINQNIIAMDGALLSGFGPRLGKALKDLNASLDKIKTND